MNDSHTIYQPADGTPQHVQATTDGAHDITLRVDRRDTVGDLIEAWRQTGVIARFNQMQRGTSPAATLALILASYATPVRVGCYILPELEEDTLRPETGLGRASFYRAQQLLRAAGIMGPSKIPGRWMLFMSPEHLDRHAHSPDIDLFAGEQATEVSPGARARADLGSPVSPGARARADLEPKSERASYSQKTSCLSVMSDDDDCAREGSDQIEDMRLLLRAARCRSSKVIEQAVATVGLTPAAVRWCVKQAKTRLPDKPSDQPGLVLRMIADGDWEGVVEQTGNAQRDADQRRAQEQAQQRESDRQWALIDQAISTTTDEELAELIRVAIESAPSDFIARAWARQPVPPTDRALRSEVFKLIQLAERTRRIEPRDPITDAAAEGSPIGSPSADFTGHNDTPHPTPNPERNP